MTELLIREFQVREVNEELRQVSGLAVPYDTPTPVGDYNEQIARGAFGALDSTPLFYGHNHRQGGMPIGKVTAFRDTDEGLEIDAVISDKTVQANEVYGLLKDGILDRFSIGFEPVEQKVDGDTVVRTKATLREVSIVPMPAYAAAKVSNVRSDEGSKTENTKEVTNVTTNEVTSEAVAEIREAVTDLERKMAGFSVSEPANAVKFRSAGELVKALAAGDEAAKLEVRSYIGTGSGLGDSVSNNDWKQSLLRIVNRGRPVVNLFSKETLGNEGNYVEYPKISGTTGDVASQVHEADNLTEIKVEFTTETAAVRTFGAYSELSRQVIERSSIPYLQKVLETQAASYAKITNNYVRAAMVSASAQSGAGFTLSSATGADFLKAIADGVQKIYNNGEGANAEFVVVSDDVWLKMASLVDSGGRPLFAGNGDGVNTLGSINVPTFRTSIQGMPVVSDSGLAAKSMYVASSEAVTSWENPGAPLRLDDENVINLTQVFSLYGYLAAGVTNDNGLVKPAIA